MIIIFTCHLKWPISYQIDFSQDPRYGPVVALEFNFCRISNPGILVLNKFPMEFQSGPIITVFLGWIFSRIPKSHK